MQPTDPRAVNTTADNHVQRVLAGADAEARLLARVDAVLASLDLPPSGLAAMATGAGASWDEAQRAAAWLAGVAVRAGYGERLRTLYRIATEPRTYDETRRGGAPHAGAVEMAAREVARRVLDAADDERHDEGVERE